MCAETQWLLFGYSPSINPKRTQEFNIFTGFKFHKRNFPFIFSIDASENPNIKTLNQANKLLSELSVHIITFNCEGSAHPTMCCKA